MKDAMKNEEPNMVELGQKLNTGRTKVLQDLKSSVDDYIPPDLISVLTDQGSIDEKERLRANEDLEKIVQGIYEMKIIKP